VRRPFFLSCNFDSIILARHHLVTLACRPPSPRTRSSFVSHFPNQFIRLTVRTRVDMFFLFHPHASRLFHRGTFIASLSYPPDHPDFPITPVLHAICAVSAIYTAAGGPRTNAADFLCKDFIFQLPQRLIG
jgi:hypothetical protein